MSSPCFQPTLAHLRRASSGTWLGIWVKRRRPCITRLRNGQEPTTAVADPVTHNPTAPAFDHGRPTGNSGGWDKPLGVPVRLSRSAQPCRTAVDLAAEILGYRAWNLMPDGRLLSGWFIEPWHPGDMRAQCYFHSDAPDSDHQCGLNAYTSPELAVGASARVLKRRILCRRCRSRPEQGSRPRVRSQSCEGPSSRLALSTRPIAILSPPWPQLACAAQCTS